MGSRSGSVSVTLRSVVCTTLRRKQYCISGSGFLGLPDPLVRSTDPDPLVRASEVRIRILPFSHKGVERTEIMLVKENFNTKFIFLKP
jgi:hypothetical protein